MVRDTATHHHAPLVIHNRDVDGPFARQLMRDAVLAQALRETVARLSARESVEIECGDALAWLERQAPASFDVAFVDPPFDAGLWQATLAALLPKLARDAWLYVESPPEQAPALPSEWTLHREGRTREVRYALYRAPDPRGADTLNGNISVAVPE